MKHLILALIVTLASASPALAYEGSWFAAGGNFEHLASGGTEDGWSAGVEGGYWYLGNVAYGGFFKMSNFGEIQSRATSSLKMYDLGVFWKAATEAGLYGKLLTGVSFINARPNAIGLNIPDGTSWFFGLGGGFLFPISESFQFGPEVTYRHYTGGSGGDQISAGALVSYSF